MNNYRQFLMYVLNDIAVPAGLITNTGGIWRLAKPFPGLEKLGAKTFNTSGEAVEAITDHYIAEVEHGNVTGVDFAALKRAG